MSSYLIQLYRSVCVLTLITILTTTAIADVIKLKNGQKVTGKIISYSDRKFTVVYEKSSLDTKAIIALDDIDSVEFDGRPLPADSNSRYETSTITNEDKDRNLPSSSTSNTVTRTQPPPNSGSITTSTSTSSMQIVTTNVVARQDWNYSKIDVHKGDKILITAEGTVRLSNKLESTPEGIESDDANKLIQDQPTGALVAVIGDDNDDFVFIGKSREFIAGRSGKLFLSINEGDLSDNSGSYFVRIQVKKASQ